MMCGMLDQDDSPPRPGRWWSSPSPWVWGLAVLLVLGATQVPRISQTFSTSPKPSTPTSSAATALSGPVYSQAMVAGRDFIRADLRGARLENLDLRGKDFQGADAAGAIFAGSILSGANLSQTNLRGGDLRDTCLRGSILAGANLAGADFTGADVTGATVTPTAIAGATGWGSTPAPSVCPRG
jgi:Pentapeptide repeats (8 copies)